jgi:RNA polymerase sigma-70 factor, ECF subfamily
MMPSTFVDDMVTKAETIHCASHALSEKALVIAAKNGSERAFEALVERYRRRIIRVAFRFTRVKEDAEDIVQQSFQKAFVHLNRFEGKSSFATWLTRIAINEALMLVRKRRAVREVSLDDSMDFEKPTPRLEIPDTRPDPETSCLQQEWVRILSVAMVELRPGTRNAIELRDLAELSLEDTARHMGLSVTVAKARVFHGRKKLREKLMRYMTSPRNKPKYNPRELATSAASA